MLTKNTIVLLFVYTLKNAAPIVYKDGQKNKKLNLELIKMI